MVHQPITLELLLVKLRINLMDRELHTTWGILGMFKITPICGLGVKESCLPYQQTKDVAVIKPSIVTVASPHGEP